MQCFLCLTYMAMMCAAQPVEDRGVAASHEKRSLFRDVIESLRIRSQLPGEIDHNDDNNLSQNYDRYGYENEPPELTGDANFIPRRNDRIEMPSLKYRFPKALQANGSEIKIENKKEDVIVYVNTPTERLKPVSTTHRPKKVPKPSSKDNYVQESDDTEDLEADIMNDSSRPIINRMEDLSQIGNREYQTVIKPTVIVNFRGTVSHRDSEIRLEKRNNPKRKQNYDSARNIFNINQEIKVERPNGTLNMEELRHMRHQVKQGLEVLSDGMDRKGGNMTKCEASMVPAEDTQEVERTLRESDNVLQIIVTL